jgi:NADPH:quinone reductase
MVKAKAIRVHELGGPEVMRWEEVELGDPKEGEIRIKTTAIGVNFIDVYFRKGVYAAPALPFTPGSPINLFSSDCVKFLLTKSNSSTNNVGREAVGVVTAVGPGLTGRKVGDVVAYAGNPMGSYAQEQILPASVAVPVPPSVDHKQAASVMLKGMTAHVLLRRVFKVRPAHLSTQQQPPDCHACAG